MKKTVLFLFFICLFHLSLQNDTQKNGQCESNALEVEDIETLRFNRVIPRGRGPVRTYQNFFTKSIRHTFNQLHSRTRSSFQRVRGSFQNARIRTRNSFQRIRNSFQNTKKRMKEYKKKREKERYQKYSKGSDLKEISKTNGCLKDMYYCYMDCKTNFEMCDGKKKFVLFVPNNLHQDLCVNPRLKDNSFGARIKRKILRQCLTSPCNCNLYDSYFKKEFPLLYEEKVQEFKKDCNQICTTNQRPASLTSENAAVKKLSHVINIFSNFANAFGRHKNIRF